MAKKGKKNQNDYWDEEYAEDLPQGEEFGTPAETDASTPAEGSTEPQTAEAGDVELDFMSTLKKSKKKQDKKKDDETAGKTVLKSKKEKEREKKEREKQLKKEAAAKKKSQQQAQKEKNKELHKQNQEKASAEKDDKSKNDDSAELKSASTPAKKPAKKGGKKMPAGIAALKRQLELKKQLEEQERLEREEEERLEREEQERIEKEEKEKEAARAEKKEKEKAKRERLKAEGKLLTKKQKEQKKLMEKRRAALLSAGNINVVGLQKKADGADESPKPKKIVYGKKKKRPVQSDEANTEASSETKESDSKNDADQTGDDDALIDDWENLDFGADDDEIADNVENTTGEATTSAEPVTEEETKEVSKEEKIVEVKKSTSVAVSTPAPTSGKKDMRSPICCILGHVDTGKTKLLDKIRQTNVQGGEAGGITQQIGATYFPIEAIKQKTEVMTQYEKQTFDVPGLLVIDTPGHESFSNLRSRGSSLCNIAILVIDIMHGLEQQTIESIKLLRDRKAPFIVALNKIDRLYDWQSTPNNSFRDSFAKQPRAVQDEFQSRLNSIQLALSEQGLNSELYFQNKNMSKYVSIVPTSAVTGEGVPDLLWLLLELTQKRMSKQLMYLSHVEATILEVKVVEGFGTTIDVILSNGYLREGDRIVLCGMNGPIVTNIRALLTPQPLRELRLKSEYVHHKEVKAALGVKIAANDLEKAVSGSRLLVVGPDDDEEDLMDDVMDDLTGLLDSVDTSGKGVTVQASTLGSLEALLDFLKDMKIPVMSIGLGPVYKRDVMKAGAMLDRAPEFAVMLCFDVKVDKEAEQYAEQEGITIFNADIIYHLFDAFTAYQEKLLEQRRKDFVHTAIFPCVLQTLQIINKRGPMIVGVDVIEGALRIGTPICAVRTDPTTKEKIILQLGRVASLEINHEPVQEVKKGQTSAGVAVRLDDPSGQQPIWGRHVDETDNLYSMISRRSIDTLKDKAFRDQVSKADWLLLKKLKPVFGIE